MFIDGSLVLTSWQDTPQEPKIMNELELLELLEQVKAGTIGPDDALNSLRRLPFADLGHAKIDHHRNLRTGVPEAIYGPNKSPEQFSCQNKICIPKECRNSKRFVGLYQKNN